MEIGHVEKYLIFMSGPKGAKQIDHFYKEASNFWEGYRPQLTQELYAELNVSPQELVSMSKVYSQEVLMPDLACTEDEISLLYSHLDEKRYSMKQLAEDFSIRANGLQFVSLLLMPGLAYAKGLGDVDEENKRQWLIGVGICYPLSSDLEDDVVDVDYPPHPVIGYNELGVYYKLGAAALLNVGRRHYGKTTTGDAVLDKGLRQSLDSSLHKVSLFNRKDVEAQGSKDVPVATLHEIYDGKIGEIEAAVFSSVPSKRREVVSTFADGARALAIATQNGKDDNEDHFGNPKKGERPKVPNPSFFLTFFRDGVRTGDKDLITAYKKALEDNYRIAMEYYGKTVKAYAKVPEDFETKPFFKSITALFKHIIDKTNRGAMEARTFQELLPQLQELL